MDGGCCEIDAPHRVVISWGRAGSPTFPPESSILEVALSAEDGGTRVNITHSGLPPAEVERHGLGWRHYLERLAAAANGREPEPHTTPDALTRGAD
jgi:uncharacterized protein YndB with AHSA1/START domain